MITPLLPQRYRRHGWLASTQALNIISPVSCRFTPYLPDDFSRVVASDERTTDFSGPGGIGTKLRLLAIESAQLFAE